MMRRAGALAVLAATGAGVDVAIDAVFGGRRTRRPLPRIRSYATVASGSTRSFRSRPDLEPPALTALTATGRPVRDGMLGAGLLFLGPGPVQNTPIAQAGPLIVDADGEPVWFKPLPKGTVATNFAASSYRGKPVLSWWEGKITSTGFGVGEGVIVDSSYREIARVRGANGRQADLHEFRLTPEGTALLTCYPETVQKDLSPIGGPKKGQVLAPIVQEVDIASGRLLLEWRSIEHVPVTDSYRPASEPYDYLHVNSVTPTPDGNLLVSGRHAWALYKLERKTGKVLWRLGGKYADFQMGTGAQFSWQHDARQISDGLITLMDNGSDGYTNTASRSRGLLLDVDERRRTVGVTTAYTATEPLLAQSMGSVQMLPDGRVMVGWGSASHTSQFASDGGLIADLALPHGLFSYRGLLLPWHGIPDHAPAIQGAREPRTRAKLIYASWNGSTGVSGWQVKSGFRADALHPIGVARRRSFETVIPVHREARYASVVALDSSGRPLGESKPIQM